VEISVCEQLWRKFMGADDTVAMFLQQSHGATEQPVVATGKHPLEFRLVP
jgi:hypothetical protein